MCSRRRTKFGYSSSWWSPCCRSSWRNARHLPHGRSRAGDRHLNFYETRDNLSITSTRGSMLVPVGESPLIEVVELWPPAPGCRQPDRTTPDRTDEEPPLQTHHHRRKSL